MEQARQQFAQSHHDQRGHTGRPKQLPYDDRHCWSVESGGRLPERQERDFRADSDQQERVDHQVDVDRGVIHLPQPLTWVGPR